MKHSKILYPIFLSIALLIGILIGVTFNFPNKSLALNEQEQREQKLRQIINYIDYEYVDELNTDSLLDETITQLVQKLDPHSSYIPLDEVEASAEAMRGSFSGIGIEFRILRDTLTVIRVIEKGPAEAAGLKQGDRILAAGEKQLFGSGISSQEVVNTLKGKNGSRVRLNIFRPSRKELALVNVKRGEVPLRSIPSSFMLDEQTAYLKLIRFAETTPDELEDELEKLKQVGASRLVLDLRDNPGGLLSVAREVADQFLEDDELIVFTKDRDGRVTELFATGDGEFEKGGVAVLINEGSASASEIVAGALQDNDRGWIIGRRSFGKGLVQEEMTLEDGSKVRLTTSRYFTPSGRSIQKPFDEYSSRNDTPMSEAFLKVEGNTRQDSFRTASGRLVFGGGGIQPDVEVPMDTSQSAAVLYHLSMLANLNEKSFRYVDLHREAFEGWSEAQFLREYEVDEPVLDYFFGRGLQRIQAQDEETQTMIRARVKAFIGYNLYGSSAFQQAYAPHDPGIQKALEILKKNNGPVK